MKCNFDCFNCQLPDCMVNYPRSSKYAQTEKGRATRRAYAKKYYWAHKEEINRRCREYYQKHKEELKQRAKIRYCTR